MQKWSRREVDLVKLAAVAKMRCIASEVSGCCPNPEKEFFQMPMSVLGCWSLRTNQLLERYGGGTQTPAANLNQLPLIP